MHGNFWAEICVLFVSSLLLGANAPTLFPLAPWKEPVVFVKILSTTKDESTGATGLNDHRAETYSSVKMTDIFPI